MNRKPALPLLAGLFVSACGGSGGGGGGGGGDGGAGSLFTPAPQPQPPAISFADVTQASNLAFHVGYTSPSTVEFPEYLVAESTFGGIAVGDCDGDNDLDLFVTYGDSDIFGSGPGGPNRLYRNLLREGSPLAFEDIALQAGVAYTRRDSAGNPVGNDRHSGPVFADFDGDGDNDLFLGGLFGDPGRLLANRGDCTFEDVTSNSPQFEAMRAANSYSAALGDYDLDGDLDLLLTHWGTRDVTYGVPRRLETDHLWENISDESGIRFINVSERSGLSALLWTTRAYGALGTQDSDFTFTPAFARINSDLWPDIAIAGDFDTSQILFNNGGGTFRNSASRALRTPLNGMGSALGDIDNDGDLDWFVTGIHNPDAIGGATPSGNRLFRNDSGGTSFRDVTDAKGVAAGEWGWGACFLDIDNDGDLDIFHVNGWNLPDDRAHNHDFSVDRSRAFVAGSNGVFTEQAASLGIDDAYNARVAVCADFDEDGDIDLLITTDESPNSALLWRNDAASDGKNYLRVRLVGLPPNTAAVGARIFVQVGDRELMREVMIGGNYTSQNPTVQVFGLGSATQVNRIRVEWPAIVPGPNLAPVQQQTLIGNTADARLRATAPGQTLVLVQPAR